MADHEKWVFMAFRRAILRAERGSPGTAAFELPTVSFTASQIPWAIERQLRWTTCAFIEDLAWLVELPEAPSILAQLFVQRFYMLHSFATHDRFLVATAALFLAGKAEEFPIKVRLLTECALFLLHCPPLPPSKADRPKKPPRKSPTGRAIEMSASLGNDPEAANAKHLDCLHALLEVLDVGEIETTAAKVLLLERVLLQTLSFDLSIPQPLTYVPRCLDAILALEAVHPSIRGHDLRVMAMIFLADAIKSGLVLAFDARELAAGAVYLACLYRRQVSPNVATAQNEPWWSVWGLSSSQLEAVARGLLWMYEDEDGAKRSGLSAGLVELWDRYRPDQNLPDLEYIRALDADLERPTAP